jgi:ferredoxin
MTTHTVRVEGTDSQIQVEEGVNLLQALREQDVYVKSSCGGVASCSDCKIKVVFGEDHLSAPPFEEIKLLGNIFHITKERLACQTTITGDVTLDLSGHDKRADEKKRQQKTQKIIRRKPPEKKQEEQEPKPPKEGGFRRPKRPKKRD